MNKVRTSDFDYHLPKELIAQTPVEPRDHSRLLVLDRRNGTLTHREHFFELAEQLRPGDLLVLNQSRVLPARLYGVRTGTGRPIELLLLRRLRVNTWVCMGKPGRRLSKGARLRFSKDDFSVEASVEEVDAEGLRTVRFDDERALERVGHTPLPPYIHESPADPERYQTVYAREPGSVAAPTAGLHFTPELLDKLRAKGIETTFVTLHVGLDTFKPVTEEDPTHHVIHTEYWELDHQAAQALNRARSEHRRVVAVGTTSVRVLEQAANLAASGAGTGNPWQFSAASGWANLFILPGYRFLAVDAMITNFHLPKSTLLMMVSAFAACHSERREESVTPSDTQWGRKLILRAYQEAIAQRYRFYSFGDAMLLL